MTRAKICGITNPEDLETAVAAGAAAVGIVTDVPVDTPREVSPSAAADLVAAAPPFVATTLVTMPESPERAVELARVVEPDVLQLHCEFDAEGVRYVRADAPATVVAAVGCGEESTARAYDDVADALLVDSTSESGAGGTGETHDWERTRELARSLSSPVVLAGGLTPENVGEAVRTVRPFAVDVATGVEREGGVKDPDAVRAFVRAASAVAECEAEEEVGP